MNLWKNYLRWRHSRGFGVHSPYAYRFVIDVLRPGPYRLYSYHEVDNYLHKKEKHDFRFEKLIMFTLRMIVFLHAKRIIINTDARVGEIAAKALNLSWVRIKEKDEFRFKEGDFLIIENSFTSKGLLSEAIKNGVPIFAINPDSEIRKVLETPIPRGLLLNDPRKIILMPRQEMEYVSYDINLGLGFGRHA